MRLIESNNDGFEFERAYVIEQGGAPLPVAVMGGVLCVIETEPGPLADGLAFCAPLDPRTGADWPVAVTIDRGWGPEIMWNMTADPKVVNAARHFRSLMIDNRAVPGMDLETSDAIQSHS